ncbi:ABC transporter permease [Mageeibacillus indolicus]|uniref:Branched-chain amino acid ABC transporter, permease protein n=2 Tax=Mageeibacillus indolicus TaxID=884684 RepID=D3R1B9_MAGIU|nr:ABC transporter permease [Mageeibacillus indolicus]ADC90339.1 branched-chain amino acid ABC transporter, permease protein [Mageeibacillus indolicus UPII9-5]KFA57616.1 sugar ABC transporter permease [Mageeibacillus indolicus 0009-5]PNH19479.1 ABC transporter permease [Mageeibacillus indolicus]
MSIVYFIIQQTMYFAIPLLIVAIGGMYSERSGVINIALEGIMVIGAFFGVLFIFLTQGYMSGQPLLLLAILIAAVAGGLFSLLHAFASINMKADQTISGTALNMFAPAFVIFIAREINTIQQIPFEDTFHIDRIPFLADIPVLGPMFFCNCYLTTFIGLLIFAVAAFVIQYTRFGLRLRACGEHPGAADSVGINVYKIRYAGVVISGIMAGAGGLIFVVPTSTNFNASVEGYGFLALAVLIFGQWRSKKIFFAAFFFAVMKTMASAYSAIPFLKVLPIPNEIYKMIPYIATLIVLAFSSKTSQAPRAEGIPYDKGSR